MRNLKLLLAASFATVLLAGCMETDSERAMGGALAGAIIADATDNSALTGAAIGALAGTFCDDANVPGCIRR